MKLTHVDIGPSPERAGHARLSGVVRYDDPGGGPAEETYWFDMPEALEGALSDSGNPWLSLLLPVAVVFREPLVLPRAVDGVLLDNAHDLMAVWHRWFPDRPPIRIDCDVEDTAALASTVAGSEARSASFFSGGVDSFCTALRERAAPLDDLILVLGSFDLAGANAAAMGRVHARMQAAADALGMPLVAVTTNHMHTRLATTDPKGLSGGSMLASVPLAMERRYARVLISASVDISWLDDVNNEPVTNGLLSTSKTRFETEGVAMSRVAKTAQVARFDAARAALRVCFVSGAADNCMTCAKCLRTAIALEALGGLEHWPTFGGKPLMAARVARSVAVDPVERYYFGELPPLCREHGRPDLAQAVERALARSRRHDRFRPLVRWMRKFAVVGAATHWLEARVQDVGVTRHIRT